MSHIKQKAAAAVARLAERTAARGKGDFEPADLPAGWVMSGGLLPQAIDPDLLREAEQLYGEAVAIFPQGVWMYQRALLLMDLGDFDAAIASFQACAEQGDYVDQPALAPLLAQCQGLKVRDTTARTAEEAGRMTRELVKDGMASMFAQFGPRGEEMAQNMRGLLDAVFAMGDRDTPDDDANNDTGTATHAPLSADELERLCEFGEDFGWALVQGRFEQAHAMLGRALQAELSADDLRREYTEMVAYAESPIVDVEAMPPDTDAANAAQGELGWLYVAIASDDISEAVSLSIGAADGRLHVRELEWGRP